MSRLLCLIGLHDWTTHVRAPGGYIPGYRARLCLRCGKFERGPLKK